MLEPSSSLPWTIHALDLSYITTTFYEVHTYSGSRETTVSVSYSVSTGRLVLLENTVQFPFLDSRPILML